MSIEKSKSAQNIWNFFIGKFSIYSQIEHFFKIFITIYNLTWITFGRFNKDVLFIFKLVQYIYTLNAQYLCNGQTQNHKIDRIFHAHAHSQKNLRKICFKNLREWPGEDPTEE